MELSIALRFSGNYSGYRIPEMINCIINVAVATSISETVNQLLQHTNDIPMVQ